MEINAFLTPFSAVAILIVDKQGKIFQVSVAEAHQVLFGNQQLQELIQPNSTIGDNFGSCDDLTDVSSKRNLLKSSFISKICPDVSVL